ncbi:MAG: hypothetical protein BGO25_05645 [Acidobacteriales bacterium 59-55]|nr:MAG: hypothetical protein ABT07_01380 [Microbacterium sp. SCN 70-10]OJV44566.1 MAG: hypothetical protein BGO25_05645 [Acidobacteriales bacterium 59-55]
MGSEKPEQVVNLETAEPPLDAMQQASILAELRLWRELAVDQVLACFGKNAQDAPGQSEGH